MVEPYLKYSTRVENFTVIMGFSISKKACFVKIIVLDRDGVINQDSDEYIKSVAEWVPEKGSIEAIIKLKKAGWTVVIATNQSGIKRGYYSRQILSDMHLKMSQLLGDYNVDWISYSPYEDKDNAVCRKPKTGMLRAIELRFDVSLKDKFMIGDSMADLSVAKNFGMFPLLVKTGKGERTIKELGEQVKNMMVYNNLLAAVERIL